MKFTACGEQDEHVHFHASSVYIFVGTYIYSLWDHTPRFYNIMVAKATGFACMTLPPVAATRCPSVFRQITPQYRKHSFITCEFKDIRTDMPRPGMLNTELACWPWTFPAQPRSPWINLSWSDWAWEGGYCAELRGERRLYAQIRVVISYSHPHVLVSIVFPDEWVTAIGGCWWIAIGGMMGGKRCWV